MHRFVFRFSVLAATIVGMLLPPATSLAGASAALPVAKSDNGKTSPSGFLNPDGTLKLDGGFSGALSLDGWDVHIDPKRGPVFGQPGSEPPPGTNMAPAGTWADVGGGGSGALNNQVRAVALIGSNVYVGGTFTTAGNVQAASYVAKWDGAAWSALGSNSYGGPALWDYVTSLAVIGTDLYVGGVFTGLHNGGTSMPQAAYVAKWDGANWSALGHGATASSPSLNSNVDALAAYGTNLYVGGYFADVNNSGTSLTAADYIAKWDGSNWTALGNDGGTGGSLNAVVLALAVSGTGDVYAGGNFTDVNNGGSTLGAADYVAKWDGVNWTALGHGATTADGSLANYVYALAVSGSNVYVGGGFGSVNDSGTTRTSAAYLAKWDGANWSGVGHGATANDPSLNAQVLAIAVNGSDLYVGGYFTDVVDGSTTLGAADYAAKWDGSNWSALGSNGAGDGSLGSTVFAVAVSGSNIFVGGLFQQINNGGTTMSWARYIGMWNGSNWSALGGAQGSLNDRVTALAINGTDVYVGGGFTDVADHGVNIPEASYIARWDGSHWHALGANGYGGGVLNGPVYAIVISGSSVYVGGYFSDIVQDTVPLTAADMVARWDGSHWHALGSNGGGDGSLNGIVTSLAVAGPLLYVGGVFSDVNNNGTVLTAADYVAAWDGLNWSALGNDGGTGGSLNVYVTALAASGANLYVGGYFSNVNNSGTVLTAADRIAKWDGSNWSALGSDGAGDGSLNAPVSAIALDGSDVYVGGAFQDVNNNGTVLTAADKVARWDGSNWFALGSDGATGGSLNDDVGALAITSSGVYVGGRFTNVNNGGSVLNAADYVALWDGSNWSAFGGTGSGDGSINSPTFATVNALAVTSTDLYVGGNFYNVADGFAVLNYADFLAAYGLDATYRGAGKYDDRDPAMVYAGIWTPFAVTGAYDNTLKVGLMAGSTDTFTFSGNRFILTYVTIPGFGKIGVYVDGSVTPVAILDTSRPVGLATYASPPLTSGAHSVVFKQEGGTLVIIDAVEVQVLTFAPAGTYDDGNSAWDYAGSWMSFAATGAFSNTLHAALTSGSTATFNFSGTRFTLTYLTFSGLGQIGVYVDGNTTPVTTIDANGATGLPTYVGPILTAGNHTVMFKHEGPLGTFVALDKLVITP